MPLCLRLIREVHAALMEGVRGQERRPGEFRTTELDRIVNGHTRGRHLVPPLPDEMGAALDDLERFLNEDIRLPVLVRCA